jgi:tricorn protease
MIRELRSSHVALHARAPRGERATRHLGIDADVLEDGTLRVAAVVSGGPADAAGIREGERIVAVGETDLAPDVDFDRLMTFPARPAKVEGLAVAVKDRNGDVRTVHPEAVTARDVRETRYAALTERRRRVVEEAGGGRFLYHAIRFMGMSEVTALREALEAAPDREALVLDVRDGLGGLAHKQVLQILDSTAPERLDRAPAASIRYRNGRTQYDKYAGGGKGTDGPSWNKPVILIINEVSRSDKEILAHTFRHLKLGYIVGMPTAAGVIGGSDRPLPDGSSITVSVQGWFTADGRNLEGSGVVPDFMVPFPFEDAYAGRDPQLLRAVELLAAQLDGRIPALQRK